MKKSLFVGAAVLALLASSCSSTTTTSTSRTAYLQTELVSPATSADLVVSEKKITYTYRPMKDVQRTGEKKVIETAVAEALKYADNADILVQPQYEVKKDGNDVLEVVVKGYPATYKNFKVVR